MKNILLCCMALLTINACKQKPRAECRWALPPNVLFFQIKENGQRLEDSVLKKIKMFYYDGNRMVDNPNDMDLASNSPMFYDTTFVFYASRTSTIPDSLGVLANDYIFANTWYIEYPNGDIDTLEIGTTKLNCDDAMANRCHCIYPLTKVVFNGKVASEITNIQSGDGKPIFLFEK